MYQAHINLIAGYPDNGKKAPRGSVPPPRVGLLVSSSNSPSVVFKKL